MKHVVTYLTFDGNCKQAMEFYKNCLGAELFVMPFSEAPAMPGAAKAGDRLMHASVIKGGTPVLMASDSMPGQPLQMGSNFSVSVHCESVEEIEKLFSEFGKNGKVTMALQDTFWGARFGMLTDQFGINWMFNYDYPKKG